VATSANLLRATWPLTGFPCARFLKFYGRPLRTVAATARLAGQSPRRPPALQRALVEFIGQEAAAAKLNIETDLVAAQQANGDLILESERQAATLEQQETEIDNQRVSLAEAQGLLLQLRSCQQSQRQAQNSGTNIPSCFTTPPRVGCSASSSPVPSRHTLAQPE